MTAAAPILPPPIRLAGPADVEPSVRTLTAAFENYPMTRSSLDPDGYLDRLARYNRVFLSRIGLPHGRVWVTDDHSAVAIWTTPATPGEAFAEVAGELRELAGSRLELVEAHGKAISLFRPKEPAWFLAVVGVSPDRQGEGLGRAIIAPGIAAADADRVPAYLETQSAANVRFYESLGFETVAELELPNSDLLHWTMRRPVG